MSAHPLVDPRGTRFAAALTSVVLAVGLVTASPWVLGLQSVVFALGAVVGLHASPYARLYRRAVAPRLGPPAELEASAPPRFAQAVGLVFALVATLGFATGAVAVGTVATALALAAAFLNAAFGFCLGCEVYLVALRLTGRTAPLAPSAGHDPAPSATPDQHTSAAAVAAPKEAHA